MEKNKILIVDNITVSYGVVKALRGVSIEVNEGEIVSLIGANNAGKSTLLETILGINRADSGEIVFMGKDITNGATDKIVASGICLVPEGRGILPMMTVMENLQLGAYHFKGDVNENLESVYNRFSVLKDRRKQIAGTLSGGEQQMLSIARGLMSRPKIMMFDEPSLGLSPVIVEDVFRIIVELNKTGLTVVLSEQNARKALQISLNGYVIEKGRVVLKGASEELINNEKVHQAYLGGGVE